jgi:hypothetical protein
MMTLIDDNKVNSEITKKYKPNYFELIHVIYMMDTKLKQSNIEQFFVETVEKFSKFIENRKDASDEDLK